MHVFGGISSWGVFPCSFWDLSCFWDRWCVVCQSVRDNRARTNVQPTALVALITDFESSAAGPKIARTTSASKGRQSVAVSRTPSVKPQIGRTGSSRKL